MNPQEWNAAREAFDGARVLGPEAVRGEVESLLSVYDADTGFLEERTEEPTPERAGRYEIVRRIGQGGMSTVYEGVRSDGGFQQRVAIKILKRGMAATGLLQRFRAERQILANLQHSHIAQLLDGGEMPDGRPFLVMEFICGECITSYCDRKQLPVDNRLELFLQVCGAVDAAHRSLIVHRDIKPGNILVTAEGDCKLLDFGIAKILDPERYETAFAHTMAAERLLTPEYASPEQIRGQAIMTASDIYSLGALLYELLCGSPPHRFSIAAD
jgi:serine/threonine protein kinase